MLPLPCRGLPLKMQVLLLGAIASAIVGKATAAFGVGGELKLQFGPSPVRQQGAFEKSWASQQPQ